MTTINKITRADITPTVAPEAPQWDDEHSPLERLSKAVSRANRDTIDWDKNSDGTIANIGTINRAPAKPAHTPGLKLSNLSPERIDELAAFWGGNRGMLNRITELENYCQHLETFRIDPDETADERDRLKAQVRVLSDNRAVDHENYAHYTNENAKLREQVKTLEQRVKELEAELGHSK